MVSNAHLRNGIGRWEFLSTWELYFRGKRNLHLPEFSHLKPSHFQGTLLDIQNSSWLIQKGEEMSS